METLQKQLSHCLKNLRKLAVVGIGSQLRADDVAGMLVAAHLKTKCRRSKILMRVFEGATAPENLSGLIKRYAPSHVLLVDAADMGKQAGFAGIVAVQQAVGASFSTHRFPMSIVAKYLEHSLQAEVYLLGIQPKSVVFGALVSKEVAQASRRVASVIYSVACSASKCKQGRRSMLCRNADESF